MKWKCHILLFILFFHFSSCLISSLYILLFLFIFKIDTSDYLLLSTVTVQCSRLVITVLKEIQLPAPTYIQYFESISVLFSKVLCASKGHCTSPIMMVISQRIHMINHIIPGCCRRTAAAAAAGVTDTPQTNPYQITSI